MIKKILLTITILMLIVSVGYGEDQPLQLTIKSDKDVYEVGEEIRLTVIWRYSGEDYCNIFHSGLHEGQNLVIKDNKGNIVDIFQTIECMYSIGKESFLLLKSNKSLSTSVSGVIKMPDRFNYPYKTKEESKNLYLLDMKDTACYLKPGIYRIQYSHSSNRDVYYNNQGKPISVENAWTGTLISNAIIIEVAEKR